MPVYEYRAITAGGKAKKGTLDAESVRAARQRLRSQGLFPTELAESTAASPKDSQDVLRYLESNRVPQKELAIVTRQLATLLNAGLTLVQSLTALAEQTDNALARRILIDVRESVEEGSSLNGALAKYPKVFPRLYINMVASGEASGTLDMVLARLADYMEKQLHLRSKVRSALIYPALMMIVCTAVIIVLFIFVIPNIVEIFVKQGATLPLPTRLMILISNSFINYWWLILLAIAAAIGGFSWYYRSPEGRDRVDRLLMKLPVFGQLYIKTMMARITLTLGTLSGSGVPLLAALDISKRIVANVHIVRALEAAGEGVREGRSLAAELKKSGLFPSMIHHMIAIGEKSGSLEEMLQRAGTAYETEVSTSIDSLTSLLEPVLMIVVGGIVLVIVLSVLLPMADLITVIQQG